MKRKVSAPGRGNGARLRGVATAGGGGRVRLLGGGVAVRVRAFVVRLREIPL